MTESPFYIYLDNEVAQVHEEIAYHQGPDGRHYVELSEPILSFSLDDTGTRSRESYARLCEWLATARGE